MFMFRRRRVCVRGIRAPTRALHLGEVCREPGQDPARHQGGDASRRRMASSQTYRCGEFIYSFMKILHCCLCACLSYLSCLTCRLVSRSVFLSLCLSVPISLSLCLSVSLSLCLSDGFEIKLVRNIKNCVRMSLEFDTLDK